MDELLKRIVINPKVMVGKPIIKGTRLTVDHIIRELATGMSQDELIEAYPQPTVDDIHAACAYAACTPR